MNNGLLLNERPRTLVIVSCDIIRRMRRFFQIKAVEKNQRTYCVSFSVTISKNRVVYEIKCRYMAEPGRWHMMI